MFCEYLQEACLVLTEISGNLRELTGERNLGVLCSSSPFAPVDFRRKPEPVPRTRAVAILTLQSSGENIFPRIPTGSLFVYLFCSCVSHSRSQNAYNHTPPEPTLRWIVLLFQKPPEICGDLRQLSGECNLGVLYSSSLLRYAHACIRLNLSVSFDSKSFCLARKECPAWCS